MGPKKALIIDSMGRLEVFVLITWQENFQAVPPPKEMQAFFNQPPPQVVKTPPHPAQPSPQTQGGRSAS